MEKEREVFDQIKWQPIRNGALKALRMGCKKIGLHRNVSLAEEILFWLIKDGELRL